MDRVDFNRGLVAIVRMAMESLERRKIQLLRDVTLPGRIKEIAAICGAAIPYEVDWASFAGDIEGLTFLDYGSCHRLTIALRVICQDEFGREAVRDGLKLVKLKNVKSRDEMIMTFAAGVLEMHCAYALQTEGLFSDNDMRDLLLQSL
jgi:hypothetical protein